MTSTTSRRLTETIKQARKERYFTKTGDLATFTFAWEWPGRIDWAMTSQHAADLYDDVFRLIDATDSEGKTLTAYQQQLLQD